MDEKGESNKLTVLQSGGRHLLKFLRHTISVFVFIPMNAGQLETLQLVFV